VGHRHHRSARGASARAGRSAAATDLVLVATLAAIGLKPADVRYVAISHIRPDHIGNVDAFPDSTLIMQRREWEAAMASTQKPFKPDHKFELLDGDRDLFGDSS
jgi:N-acyl homoserine lactone hydrolase